MARGPASVKMMRPSRIVALVDLAALCIAAALLIRPAGLAAGFVVTAAGILALTGAYRPRMCYRLSPQLPVLFAQVGGAALVVSCWPAPHRLRVLARFPVVLVVVVAGRLLTYWLLRTVRGRHRRAEVAVVVGAGPPGRRVAEALLHHRGCGIVPVGFVDDRPGDRAACLPVVGALRDLDELIARFGIRHVIVAEPGRPDDEVCSQLWRCQAQEIDVWTVPSLFERGADPCGQATDAFWTIPFQHLRRPGQHTAARTVKRSFDVAVAALVLVLIAPVMAAVALAVRLTSAGPVFFRQRRVGQNGREFELLKFRTMHVNNDSDVAWSVRDRARITSIGRFLRASSIDELPQVLNVLRGDMSLVGPRPERPFFHDRFSQSVPEYTERLRAPMGITGWAQVHGLRGDTSIEERTRFDNFYIEHWSLWLDVVIMLRTVAALVSYAMSARTSGAGAASAQDGALSQAAPASAGLGIVVTSAGPAAVAAPLADTLSGNVVASLPVNVRTNPG